MKNALPASSSVIPVAAHWPATMGCGTGAWAVYWFAWQRAQELAAKSKPRFDPHWN